MLWLLLVLIVFIFQTGTILLFEFRKPSKAVAWLFILFCFPLIGFVVYYFVAQDYQKRKVVRKGGSQLFREFRERLWAQSKVIEHVEQMHNPHFKHQERLFNQLIRMSENPLTGCNRTRVLTNGEEAFDTMLAAMEHAQHHIHVEFYIFRPTKSEESFKRS